MSKKIIKFKLHHSDEGVYIGQTNPDDTVKEEVDLFSIHSTITILKGLMSNLDTKDEQYQKLNVSVNTLMGLLSVIVIGLKGQNDVMNQVNDLLNNEDISPDE